MDRLYHALLAKSDHLEWWEMSLRTVVVFFFTLLLIRLSGRRSFGIKSPLDTIVGILLGTLLGRVIVGVSPFLPVAAASAVLVIIHRVIGFGIARNKSLSHLAEGEKIVLFEKGKFHEANMLRAMVSREDIFRSMREAIQTEDIAKIEKVYIEPTGKINIVKKA